MYSKGSYGIVMATVALSLAMVVGSASAKETGVPAETPGLQGRQAACEARKAAIAKHAQGLVAAAAKRADRDVAVVTKVETFYEESLAENGTAVADYEALKTAVTAKRAAVGTAAAAAQAKSDGFSCANGDPKEGMKELRTSMQSINMALRELRASARTLVVAVRKASAGVLASPDSNR